MLTSSVSGDLVEPPDVGEPIDGSPRTGFVGRDRPTGWDQVGLVAGLLLVVLFAPFLFFGGWTVRAALLLGLGPVGLVALLALGRARDRAALLLIAALAWTLLVSVWNPAPRSALLGAAGRDLSAWTVLASAGLYAVGRLMSRHGARLLGNVVIWASSAAAAVALLQVLANVTSGPLALAAGRPSAFQTNPVYLGAICASALALAVRSASDASWLRELPPVLLLGAGTTVSGSRVALLAAVVALVAVVAVERTRPRLTSGGVAIVGLALGVLIDRWFGAGRNAADRLAEGSGGGRLEVWWYGLQAWLDRPVLGHGFGRFRPAVQGRFSVDFVRDHAADETSQAWFDAHNVVIGLLVAVGVVGTVLFVAWAVVALLRASGPLLWALVPVALHWMLQPVSIYTLPLAMLMLGAAAGTAVAPREPSRRASTWVVGAAAGVGAVLGSGLIAADVALDAAADDLDSDRAATVATWFLRDPIVDDVVAQLMVLDPDNEDPAAELEWRARVADDEPDRPYWWSLLARRQIASGLFDEAEVSIRRAAELQPNNVRTWQAEAILAVNLRDEQRLTDALERLCDLGQPECELTAAELLENPSEPGP